MKSCIISQCSPQEERDSSWYVLEHIEFVMRSKEQLQFASLSSIDSKHTSNRSISSTWKLFLFGNGSPTQHLALLTGLPTQVDVISMKTMQQFETNEKMALLAYDAIQSTIAPQRVQRQVWLHNSSQPLGYAASWTSENDLDIIFPNVSVPIGQNVSEQKLELYRDIQSVFCGESAQLEKQFGCSGPFWGRTYFFRYRNRPITFIYEVFSPVLTQYLGPVLV
uniref:Uncharacterized protein AlNc14C213G8964 n=1 Tax=Albugo laibachii Nc14 TaxID=890382 RepID=F0WRG1_9STRA|nr:conserved hypothetical protein [Albugo laibachii Nc14]|eukprot:CCA23924.1 conserved hypothetical protein [Albugo laibachii Nc14]